jgi:hypothetical protein
MWSSVTRLTFYPGSLGDNLPAWEFILLGHPERLLSWLRDGVDMHEFFTPYSGVWKGQHYSSSTLPPAVFPNHPAALSSEFSPFITAKIAEMVSIGALCRLGLVGSTPRPRVVLPVGVEPD